MLRVTNKKQFQKAVDDMLKMLPEMQIQVLKKISLDSYKDLQDTTPEDTARAKGGWNTSVDGKPSDWKPAKAEGKRGYQKQPFQGLSSVKPGSTIHLSNNVEYMEPLDEGHSTQAPDGIVDVVYKRQMLHLKEIVKQLSRKRIK